MKKMIRRLAVATIAIVTSWGMTTSATELKQLTDQATDDSTVYVDFSFQEDFLPSIRYVKEDSEVYMSADEITYAGKVRRGCKVCTFQRTDNGFCLITVDGTNLFYIREDMLTDRMTGMQTEPRVLLDDTDEVLFVYTSNDILEKAVIENPATGQVLEISHQGLFGYGMYGFITEETEKLIATKYYEDGSVICQEFSIDGANEIVGIYDDGSGTESWLEIDFEMIY